MVMLQAFVDDSASDRGDRRLYLAGYINLAPKWAGFSDAWERELKRHPAIEYFKMSEAESRSTGGQFEGWSAEDRNKKVLALAHIIENSKPIAIYCSVSREEYSRILAPVVPYALKNPYGACFWEIMRMTAEYHRGFKGAPPVDFIFDEQGALGTQAAMWYSWLKEGLDPSIRNLLGGPPIFRNDKIVVALQAADMLAWHLRRRHESTGTENRPTAPLLTARVLGKDIDAATLKSSARKMRRVPGVRYVQTKASWRRGRKALEAQIDAGLPAPSMNPIRMHWLYAKVRIGQTINRLRHPRRR
jgi:hypothetical protein